MESWHDYYRSDRFRNELRSLPVLFPSASECPHTGVPAGLRVLLDDDALTRDRVQALLAPELRCAWFGLCLVSMTLHSRFGRQAGAWAERIFCPIPEANVPEAAEITSIPGNAIATKLLGEPDFQQKPLPRLMAAIMDFLPKKFTGE
jgi:hypothetical protein